MLKNVKAWYVTFKVTFLNTYERYNYVFPCVTNCLDCITRFIFLFFSK